jgi:2-polyprenyl-3-methyl-5-hydroxy-6-metoxy-1,4-benzoquinol methylase
MYIKELENYDKYVGYQNGRAGALTNANTIFRDLHKIDITLNKDSYILDIGCRAGAYTVREFIKNGHPNSYGIDIGESAQQHWLTYECKDNLKCADIHNGNPFDHKWDFITMSHTLEHLYDPHKVIKIIHESMSKDGVIHGIIPIEESIEGFQKHNPHMVMFESHEEHVKFYENNGFDVFYDELELAKAPNSIIFARKK